MSLSIERQTTNGNLKQCSKQGSPIKQENGDTKNQNNFDSRQGIKQQQTKELVRNQLPDGQSPHEISRKEESAELKPSESKNDMARNEVICSSDTESDHTDCRQGKSVPLPLSENPSKRVDVSCPCPIIAIPRNASNTESCEQILVKDGNAPDATGKTMTSFSYQKAPSDAFCYSDTSCSSESSPLPVRLSPILLSSDARADKNPDTITGQKTDAITGQKIAEEDASILNEIPLIGINDVFDMADTATFSKADIVDDFQLIGIDDVFDMMDTATLHKDKTPDSKEPDTEDDIDPELFELLSVNEPHTDTNDFDATNDVNNKEGSGQYLDDTTSRK